MTNIKKVKLGLLIGSSLLGFGIHAQTTILIPPCATCTLTPTPSTPTLTGDYNPCKGLSDVRDFSYALTRYGPLGITGFISADGVVYTVPDSPVCGGVE